MTRSISFAATGDSFISRPLPPSSALAAIGGLLRQSDARFTNFETLTPGENAIPNAISGGTWASAPAQVIPDLQALGFNLFGLATNHAMDFLQAGLMATEAAMNRHSAVCAGAGANLAEAGRPRYLETANGRVALIAVCSTLHETAVAGQQRPDMIGRPGVNPLRFTTTHLLPKDQLDALMALAAVTGVNVQREIYTKEGVPDTLPPGVLAFGQYRFKEGQTGVETAARPGDVARIVATIADARRQADRVLLSLHAHEQIGSDKTLPATFLEDFSRAAIDAGADAVIGHGPHVLRGIEIYRGRPIFYSLGNFIFQNETIPVLPQDYYDKFKLDLTASVQDAMDKRYDDGRKGFPANPWAWKSVIARWVDDGARATSIALHPVALGFGEGRAQRGLPELSEEQEVLVHLAELSARYGTQIDIQDGIGLVRLN